MSPNVFRLLPPPEEYFGGEPCGTIREQDGCFCCFLFCGSEEFLKTGFFWLLPAAVTCYFLHWEEVWAHWRIEHTNRCSHDINEWCGHIPAPGLLLCSSSVRGLPVCISLRVWLRKSWLHVVEWRKRCQFFSLRNWEVWFRDRRGSVQAERGALKQKRPQKRYWTDTPVYCGAPWNGVMD